VTRLLVLLLALAAAGCGGGDEPSATTAAPGPPPTEVDLAGGTTTLRLDPLVVQLLETGGVEVRAIAPATLEGEVLAVPIAAGRVEPSLPTGTADHEGGVRFSAAGGSVEATALRLDAAAGAITGEVEGGRVPIFAVRLQPSTATSGVAVGRLEVATASP
jgi:hypothetical protein